MFIPASAPLAMHSIYIGQLVWLVAAPLIVCMHLHLGGVAIVYYYPHPAWGGLFETENGLLFYEAFFINLYYIRMHCFKYYLTKDLNHIQMIHAIQ